jgi:hypothetical protein
MKSLITEIKSLTDSEKINLLAMFLLAAFVVASVSIMFNITRGADVDYFKERLVITEARLNSIDKKVDDTRDKYDRQLEGLKDRTNETARKVEEQEKWIEEWKKLPSLPKPKR